jgi:hypothetical protein
MVATVRRFAFPVIRQRYGPATVNADGFPVAAVVSSTSILIHMHPATGEQLKRMPDGLEPSNVQQGYTPDELQLGDEATGQRPDTIVAFGETYEVVERSPWSGGRDGVRSWRQCLLNEVRGR